MITNMIYTRSGEKDRAKVGIGKLSRGNPTSVNENRNRETATTSAKTRGETSREHHIVGIGHLSARIASGRSNRDKRRGDIQRLLAKVREPIRRRSQPHQ